MGITFRIENVLSGNYRVLRRLHVLVGEIPTFVPHFSCAVIWLGEVVFATFSKGVRPLAL